MLTYQADRFRGLVVVVHTTEIEGVLIPRTFPSDGATIPRPLWPFVGSPFSPDSLEAAVVHDYLYSMALGTRKDADKLFHKMLRQGGVGRLRAGLMWLAVRLFGRGRYTR
jgi:hypothetical protein